MRELLLFVGLIGALCWIGYKEEFEIPAIKSDAKEEIARLVDQIDELRGANRELSRKRVVQEEKKEVVVVPDVVDSEPPATIPVPVNPSFDVGAALQELDWQYKQKNSVLDAKYEEVVGELEVARKNLNNHLNSAPSFNEQSSRYDNSGNRIGNKGIRTSAADRKLVQDKYNAITNSANKYISGLQEQLSQIRADQQTLQNNYNQKQIEIRQIKGG